MSDITGSLEGRWGDPFRIGFDDLRDASGRLQNDMCVAQDLT
jgi:hypothetical protein